MLKGVVSINQMAHHAVQTEILEAIHVQQIVSLKWLHLLMNCKMR